MAIDLGPSGSIGGAGFGRSEVSTAVDALGTLKRRPAWHADAACREHPEVSFFPMLGESLEPARAVCARCLVRDECLAHALERAEKHGVWGGTSERERRAIRRLRRAS